VAIADPTLITVQMHQQNQLEIIISGIVTYPSRSDTEDAMTKILAGIFVLVLLSFGVVDGATIGEGYTSSNPNEGMRAAYRMFTAEDFQPEHNVCGEGPPAA
jgi:hypothetical protein